MMTAIFISVGLAAFLVSVVLTRFMIKIGLTDIPDHRSSHSVVMPTSGGVGILAAVVTAWAAFYWGGLHHGYNLPFWPVLMPILMIGVLGFLDDKYTLPTLLKFGLIILVSVGFIWNLGPITKIPIGDGFWTLPYMVGFAGTLLWIFTVTNGVNFMDGSNGIMISVMGTACLTLIIVFAIFGLLQEMWLPIGLLAGLLGLGVYNFKNQARIFAGDVGSLTVGFGFALASLILVKKTPDQSLLYVGPLLILPFLADILLTMARRLKRRENLLTPHRSHIYQRAIQAGQTHIQIAILYGVLTLIMAVNVLAIITLGSIDNPLYLIAAILMSITVYSVANRRLS